MTHDRAAPPTGVDGLVARLRRHEPASSAEAASVRRTLALLRWLPAPLDEHADPVHVTASAIVVARSGSPRVVLHLHRRLGRWLQPGGHLDPGEDVADAAIREVREETGLAATHPPGGPRLVHVDVHQGPRGHVHLDTRWLLLADPDTPFRPGEGESAEVAWFGPRDAAARGDRGLAEAIATALAVASVGRPPGAGRPPSARQP